MVLEIQVEKVAKALEAKAVPSATGRFFVTTSRASRSRPSAVSLAVAESSVFQQVSFLAFFLRVSTISHLVYWDGLVANQVAPFLRLFFSDLRGDAWCAQVILGKRHPRCRHLHRACQAQDGHLSRRRLCAETTRPHSLWVWWLESRLLGLPLLVLVTLPGEE